MVAEISKEEESLKLSASKSSKSGPKSKEEKTGSKNQKPEEEDGEESEGSVETSSSSEDEGSSEEESDGHGGVRRVKKKKKKNKVEARENDRYRALLSRREEIINMLNTVRVALFNSGELVGELSGQSELSRGEQSYDIAWLTTYRYVDVVLLILYFLENSIDR